ncbi:hypothetical protein M4D81_27955 [Paenibacillus sp. p3-SID867]|uniref:hypothetical protein n=1 Tax=Paenibacillus sp. p3-SID867 TaxID=2916363 RepID=UPI0021A927A7|nr:hypothetical protein [Paenibacillus sp. p3-SID867]MCT1402833.1 hypothetical protein [Paenibacillus sp. p3-SID867]
MNVDKPDWYTRTQKVPFPNETFTAEMKKYVHMSVICCDGRPKRRKYLRVGIVSGLLLLIIFIAIQPFGDEGLQTAGDVTPEAETIRAQGVTEEGMLSVVAVEKEKITELGAPSCFGLEAALKLLG